jgi:hypothetical protein
MAKKAGNTKVEKKEKATKTAKQIKSKHKS